MMNKKILAIWIAIIGGCVGLAALIILNFEPSLTYGTIYSKEYFPYREWETEEEMCVNVGSWDFPMNVCTPYTAQHSSPDTWYIDIEGTNDKGTEMTRRIRVPKELFDSSDIGGQFFVPGEQGDE